MPYKMLRLEGIRKCNQTRKKNHASRTDYETFSNNVAIELFEYLNVEVSRYALFGSL